MALTAGDRLGSYEIGSLLGAGGMGEVYKARDTRLDRTVAIKVLPEHIAKRDEARQRFEREARAVASLNHPHICVLHDIGSQDGTAYMVMEHLEGETLGARLQRGALPLEQAIAHATHIADALDRAHRAGVMHRDVKPGNIMLTRDGVKVLDFGLAKSTHKPGPTEQTLTAALTTEGAVIGTPQYMAPEQFEGKEADARSDIWAFGAVLYEMVTGRKAFLGKNYTSMVAAILGGEPAPMDAKPFTPAWLERLVKRCLQKDPEDRYQAMRDVVLDLKSPPAVAETAPSRSRLGWVAAVLGVALAAGLAGLAYWAGARGSPPPRQPLSLKRLTLHGGLARDPAISSDGKMVAYSSDHAGEGSLDIWVQLTEGGDPIRVTNDPADDIEPSFSPDGTRIAYRSERDGGGIYVVPALGGGEPRLLAAAGRLPRYSPDGNQIVYMMGELHAGAILVAGRPTRQRVRMIPATGGESKEISEGLQPLWSPDGRDILFTRRGRNSDWYMLPAAGGDAVPLGMRALFEKLQIAGASALAGAWQEGEILFAAASGDSQSIWRLPLSSGNKPAGLPERITFGSGAEFQPSLSPTGRLVFSNISINANLWSVPLDPRTGSVSGVDAQLTQDASMEFEPQLSADGRRLVFTKLRGTDGDIWLRDMNSLRQIPLAASPINERRPVISPDGTRMVYVQQSNPNVVRMIRLKESRGFVQPEDAGKVCDNCSAFSWSPDGSYLSVHSSQTAETTIDVIELASGKRWTALSRVVQYFQWSPDGQWVSFHLGNTPLTRQVYIARFVPGQNLGKESDWIPVFDGKGLDREATWSRGGDFLYFYSERDGNRCVWKQNLDPATKRPVGEPAGVYHAHGGRSSLSELPNNLWSNPAFAPGRMVVSLGEKTGSIWMAEFSPKR